MADHNPLNARARVLGKNLPGHFKIEVWGAYPHDFVKTYTIKAKKQEDAIREAIREFNQTMSWGKEKKDD